MGRKCIISVSTLYCVLKSFMYNYYTEWASQRAPEVKNLPANARNVRDLSSVPGLGRFPGGGNGNPLLYSCLENPMD